MPEHNKVYSNPNTVHHTHQEHLYPSDSLSHCRIWGVERVLRSPDGSGKEYSPTACYYFLKPMSHVTKAHITLSN